MELRNHLLCTAAMAASIPSIAHTQPSDVGKSESSVAVPSVPSGGLQDIVVTARRTAENLQRVPIAVTGINAATIANLQIQNFGDVAKMVPNLDSQRQFGSASSPQFFLRGVATGSLKFETDAGIGLYIDGVYLGRPAGSAFDLADIDHIEVLRGPQGTLFGRNSTGGAINFVTAAPKGKFGISAEATYGNYDRKRGRISVELPAFGPISARISYLHDENRGYVKNLTPDRLFDFAQPFGPQRSARTFGAENTDAIAAAVRGSFDRLTIDYKFDYTDKVSSQLGQQLLFAPAGYPGTALGAGTVTVPISTKRLNALPLDFTSPSHLKIQGHSLTAAFELNDVITLKSITGYRKIDENVGANDIDGGAFVTPTAERFTPLGSVEDRHQHQWSEEAQILGHTDAFDFVFGGFYFNENGRDNNPVFLSATFPESGPLTPAASPGGYTFFGLGDYFLGSDSRIENTSYAGYAHGTYRIGDHIELAAGIRYTKDKREETLLAGFVIAPPTQRYRVDGSHWDYDATATYILDRHARIYGRIATGYLSGGVLDGVPFKQESIKSYEVGLKADVLDNRLRINLAAFQSDRHNLQVITFGPTTGTILVPLRKERDRGYEVELAAVPTDGLTFNFSLGYLDAKLSQDLGPRQSLAPRYTASLSGQYDLPKFGNGSYVSLRADAVYKDNRFSDPVPNAATLGVTTLPSRVDIAARVSLSDIPLGPTTARVSAWVQNLSNNRKLEFARDLGGPVIGVFQVPRTFGLDIGVKF